MTQAFTDGIPDWTHVTELNVQQMRNNFATLKSSFSGNNDPPDPVAGMTRLNTSSHRYGIRNETNTAYQEMWNTANNKPIITNLSNEITAVMLHSSLKSPAASVEGLRKLGTGATDACAGNDVRLTLSHIFKNKQIFTSNGTFYRPANYTHVIVIAVGGGGAGGAGQAYSGGGGGAGEVICKVVNLSGYSSVAVTIGAAGAASGGNGGNTTFGSLLTAHGGSGGDSGLSGVTRGGAGGARTLISSDTDILFSMEGGRGGGGGKYSEEWIWSGGSLYNYDHVRGGHGGSPAMGFDIGATGIQGTGSAGSGYGSGGSGGGYSAGPQYSGGAGRPGMVIVRW